MSSETNTGHDVKDSAPARRATVVRTVSHIAIDTGNFEASLAFYQDQLGLRIVYRDDTRPGHREAKGLLGDFAVEIAERHDAAAPGGSCLSFTVEDFDASFAAFHAAGLVEGDAPGTLMGARFFSVRDPDGRAVEIIALPGDAPSLGAFMAGFFPKAEVAR